jgi:hypothetical protein
MNWRPFLYKWHKWFAVAVGLLTFIWFASGVVMMLPSPLFGGKPGPRGPAEQLDFRQAKVTVPQAIAVLETATGRPARITGVSMRRLRGRLLYSLATAGDKTYFVDAISGEPFSITEEIARQIALSTLGEGASLGPVSQVKKYGWEYTWGPLPVYRFEANDAAGTIVYVAMDTGESRTSDRAGRTRALLADSHTLQFLRPLMPQWSVKLTMLVFSAVGVVMTLLGGAILWLQLRTWWQNRWRTT